MLKLRIIGILNFFIFQWLFIRLYFEFDKCYYFELENRGKAPATGFGIMFPRIPMTGWLFWNDKYKIWSKDGKNKQ